MLPHHLEYLSNGLHKIIKVFSSCLVHFYKEPQKLFRLTNSLSPQYKMNHIINNLNITIKITIVITVITTIITLSVSPKTLLVADNDAFTENSAWNQ